MLLSLLSPLTLLPYLSVWGVMDVLQWGTMIQVNIGPHRTSD